MSSEVDWVRGIGYSVLASVIGGASKLAIRKSWLIEQVQNNNNPTTVGLEDGDSGSSYNSDHDETTRKNTNDTTASSTVDDFNDSNGGHVSTTKNNPSSVVKIKTKRDENSSDYVLYDNRESSSPSHQQALSVVPISNETSSDCCSVALCLRLSGMIGMTFLNPLFCVLAMNYASPSILAPFSGLTLVWIILFSEVLIGEKPNCMQVFAASLIVLGEVVVAIWGDHSNDDGVSIDDVVLSYKSIYFQMYFFVMALWMFAIWCMINQSSSSTLRRFAWGVSGGSITGFQNFLKDSLTIIKYANAYGLSYPWYLYILISFGAATAFGGLLCLTACMKRYDATFSSASFVGSFVISASIMSAVHYSTFQNLVGLWNWILYPSGLLILMVGVLILVRETTENDIIEDIAIISDANLSLPNHEIQQPLVLELDENRKSQSFQTNNLGEAVMT